MILAAAMAFGDNGVPTPAGDGLTQEMIRDAYKRYTPAIVLIEFSVEITDRQGRVTKRDRTALGLIVSESGLVMTHGHMKVQDGAPFNIKVKVGEGERLKTYDAVFLEKPDDINVCFVQIKPETPTKFPFVKFDRDATIEIGEPLLILGVLADTLDNARGFVVRRLGSILNEPRRTYILDEPVTFGYIGGPVVTASGRVAGVVGLDLSAAEGGELYTRSGHPLVYQAALFHKYLDRPPAEAGAADKEAEEAWLGVYTQPLTDDLAEYWRLPKQGGIVVSTVVPGSPAESAGIRSGDIVIEFNGKPITAKLDPEVTQFQKIVRESPLDQPLSVIYYRDGERQETSLTLSRRPKTAATAREYEETVLGLTVRELTQDVRISLNLPEDVEGVIVRRVRSGSPANQARIAPFFVVMRVGDRAIRGIDDYEAAIAAISEQKPTEVVLFCRIEASTAFYRLLPRWE